MITKEIFVDYLTNAIKFDKAVNRLEEAISGKPYGCDLYESDWCLAESNMLDLFLRGWFNVQGLDLIYWWMYESVDKVITQKVDSDLFNGESEINYDVESIDDLWNYLVRYKNDYFLNA